MCLYRLPWLYSCREENNKGISNIRYNLLNLPEEVTFTNGNSTKFFYSAEGEKLRAVHTTGGTFASSTTGQPYKYNGKELDTHNGLNWYDYGA